MITERIKTLKVIGEAVGQVVVENQIRINAVKIDRIKVELGDLTDHLFKNKVVKQGVIIKDIFFVDRKGILRSITEKIPFLLTVDIPGFKPNPLMEVQNHLLDIDVDFSLTPATQCRPGCLRQIIVAHILVVAAEWVQLDVVTGVEQFPKISLSNRNGIALSDKV